MFAANLRGLWLRGWGQSLDANGGAPRIETRGVKTRESRLPNRPVHQQSHAVHHKVTLRVGKATLCIDRAVQYVGKVLLRFSKTALCFNKMILFEPPVTAFARLGEA